MKRILVLVVGILALAIYGGYFFAKAVIVSQATAIPSPVITPTPQLFGTPVNLSIPKLGITTTIESVGLDAKKNMDVPKEDMNVGWYQYGVKPGEVGNAVLAGHFDKKDGSPAVFYRLDELKTSDIVEITDETGNKYTFWVIDTNTYPVDAFPLDKVFGKATDRYLNLITCGGAWNTKEKGYTNRVVVRAKLIKY